MKQRARFPCPRDDCGTEGWERVETQCTGDGVLLVSEQARKDWAPAFSGGGCRGGSVWGSLCSVNCRPRLPKESLMTASVPGHDFVNGLPEGL